MVLLKRDVLDICNSDVILNNIRELYYVTEPGNVNDFDLMWNSFHDLDKYKVKSKKFKKLYNNHFLSNDFKEVVLKYQFFDWLYIVELLFLKVLDDAKKGNQEAIGFIENNLFILFLEDFYIKSDEGLEVESLKLLDGNYKNNFKLIDGRDSEYSFKDGKIEVIQVSKEFSWEEQMGWNFKVVKHFLNEYYRLSLNNKGYLILLIHLLDLLKSTLVSHINSDKDRRDINKTIYLIKKNIYNSQDKEWVEFLCEHLMNWWD